MGMYDNVLVEEGFIYLGKTFKDFQTKDFDCILHTITFGKEINNDLIPSTHEFCFYGFSLEEKENSKSIQAELKEKYTSLGKPIDIEFYSELRELDNKELTEFIGLLDHKNVFYMILSKDRKEILMQIEPQIVTSNLHGWDDEKIYYTFQGKEICISEYPVLLSILEHHTKLWLINNIQ